MVHVETGIVFNRDRQCLNHGAEVRIPEHRAPYSMPTHSRTPIRGSTRCKRSICARTSASGATQKVRIVSSKGRHPAHRSLRSLKGELSVRIQPGPGRLPAFDRAAGVSYSPPIGSTAGLAPSAPSAAEVPLARPSTGAVPQCARSSQACGSPLVCGGNGSPASGGDDVPRVRTCGSGRPSRETWARRLRRPGAIGRRGRRPTEPGPSAGLRPSGDAPSRARPWVLPRVQPARVAKQTREGLRPGSGAPSAHPPSAHRRSGNGRPRS